MLARGLVAAAPGSGKGAGRWVDPQGWSAERRARAQGDADGPCEPQQPVGHAAGPGARQGGTNHDAHGAPPQTAARCR